MKLEDCDLVATTNDLSQGKNVEDIADFIEFQMEIADDSINQLSDYKEEIPLIVTNRNSWDSTDTSESKRIDKLTAAARFDHVKMVDIELRVVRDRERVVEELHENDVEIIVSYYNFEQTPDKKQLTDIIRDCNKYGDISKVAVFAEEMVDSLTLLEVLNTTNKMGMRVAGTSMGENTRHARAIAPFYGSELVYAPINPENSGYAPGQITIRELASLIETIAEGGDHVNLMDSLKGKFPNS